ncbi:hypothetical protein E2C01_063351 [Portunus trituberculatus]|uniref:Uncharacterized protein n=1 Tax=Portunus trituberculatus TaxID=210409 RepID=A0A5B7HGU1_PORTR|nr:hypothetical protein [Portunus trituberculatus]
MFLQSGRKVWRAGKDDKRSPNDRVTEKVLLEHGWRVRGKERKRARAAGRWLKGRVVLGVGKYCLGGRREVKWREGGCEARSITTELTG